MAIILKGIQFKRIFPTCDMCRQCKPEFTLNLRGDKGELVSCLHVCKECRVDFEAGDDFVLEVVPYDNREAPSVDAKRGKV